jgi:hypothetical protein
MEKIIISATYVGKNSKKRENSGKKMDSQPIFVKHRETSISHEDEKSGYRIKCYGDVTELCYFEKINNEEKITHRFELSQGIDKEVFKEALRLRELSDKEDGTD